MRALFTDSLVHPVVGPGVHAGLEVDAGASISVRLHGSFDWFITLNGSQRFSVGAVMVATSF